jgi:glucose-6-phosphate-specific signal transduction histidine kinase
MGSERRIQGGSFPWYRSHQRTVLIVASGLFAIVTVAHIFANGTGEAVDVLYSLPVALLAVSFGLRGGVTGAVIGLSLFAVVELTYGSGDIDVTGWIARAAGLFLLGVLLGHATDQIQSGEQRMLAAQEERLQLAERARRQAEALEISDSILQHLAAAKWMAEIGNDKVAVEILASTIETGEQMVAELLPIRHRP